MAGSMCGYGRSQGGEGKRYVVLAMSASQLSGKRRATKYASTDNYNSKASDMRCGLMPSPPPNNSGPQGQHHTLPSPPWRTVEEGIVHLLSMNW